MDTPQHAELLRIVDPYFYRNRLTMPKYVVNAAGDQYFPPDSSKFYFGDLQGPKYLRYVPNADHSLRGSDAQDSILAFYQAVLNQNADCRSSPGRWLADGSIRVETESKPREVNLWQATNPKARDFRLMTIGPAYKQSRCWNRAKAGLRRAGAQAGDGVDGLLRRADVRQRREGAVQVHDAGEHRARRVAAQIRGVSQGREVSSMDRNIILSIL